MYSYREHLSRIIRPVIRLLTPIMMIMLGLAGCSPGTLGTGVVSDPCFEGLYTETFTDGRFDLDVRMPSPSAVHFMGWHTRPERVVPWSSIAFEGDVELVGRAVGQLTVNFSLDDGRFVVRDAGETRLFLAGTGDCASRDTLEVRFSYTDPDDVMQSEIYELTRVPE